MDCLNCEQPLKKKYQRKYCSWNCKVEFEAKDKHLTPLSRLAYTKSNMVSLEDKLNEIESEYKRVGRSGIIQTVQYNPNVSKATRLKIDSLLIDLKAFRKSLN